MPCPPPVSVAVAIRARARAVRGARGRQERRKRAKEAPAGHAFRAVASVRPVAVGRRAGRVWQLAAAALGWPLDVDVDSQTPPFHAPPDGTIDSERSVRVGVERIVQAAFYRSSMSHALRRHSPAPISRPGCLWSGCGQPQARSRFRSPRQVATFSSSAAHCCSHSPARRPSLASRRSPQTRAASAPSMLAASSLIDLPWPRCDEDLHSSEWQPCRCVKTTL